MSYDDTNDAVVDALRFVLKANCNAALSPIIDHETSPAIDKTFGFPLTLSFVRQARLPALAVYRLRENVVEGGKVKFDRVTFRADYYAPKTTLEKLNYRWPLLKQVYDCIKESLTVHCGKLIGSDEIVTTTTAFGDTEVEQSALKYPSSEHSILEDAGIVDLVPRFIKADYSFALVGGSNAYPFVSIEFIALCEEFGLRDTTDLCCLLGMNASFLNSGDGATEAQPRIISNTTAGEQPDEDDLG